MERVSVSADQLREWSIRERAGDLFLIGPCPACRHSVSTSTPLSVNAYEAAPRPGALTASLGCRCGQAHPFDERLSNPDGTGTESLARAGCGRTWTVRAVGTPDGYVLEPATDPELVTAAEALREATAAELSTVRAGAEKWIAGVTAFYGLFGIAGIVVGRDAVAQVPDWGRVLVGVTVLAALLAAAFAVLAAYRAAYGLPVVRPVRDDDELLNWHLARRRAPQLAVAWLRRAVGSAVASLVALAVALGLLWLLPSRDRAAAPVRVMLSDGSQLCGAILDTGQRDVLRLRLAGDGSVSVVPLRQLASLTTVSAC